MGNAGGSPQAIADVAEVELSPTAVVDTTTSPEAVAPPERPRLRHVPGLDGVRGIAVALVLGVHSGNSLWPEAKNWLAKGGPLGVHLFFVLSGFLITALLLGEREGKGRIDLLAFARRRALRLVPVIVALLAVLVVVAATGERLVLQGVLARGVYVLTFTSNLYLVHGDAPPVVWLFGRDYGDTTELAHMWSVGVEAQFYAFWALTLWAATRARWSYGRIALLTAGLIAAVAAWRAYQIETGESWLRMYLAPSTRMDAPLVGSLVGVVFCAGWLRMVPTRLATGAAAVGLALFMLAAFTIRLDEPALYYGLYTVLALCGACVVVGVLRAPDTPLSRALAWRPLAYLGMISYSIYVWHYGLFWIIERHDPTWPGPVRLGAGLAATMVVSALSYRYVEQPFLRRRRSVSAAPA